MHRNLCKCVRRHFSTINKSGSNFKDAMGCSWCLYLFFWGPLIRACTRSFENVYAGTSPLYIKVGQIWRLSKNESWVLVDACRYFFVGHDLEHAQEALEMCQNAHQGFHLLWGNSTYHQMLIFWCNELFLSPLLLPKMGTRSPTIRTHVGTVFTNGN